MSFVSGLLGAAGGAGGTGFSGPTGTDQGQLNTAYGNTQAGIKQQQDFVNALSAQNGIGNQSSVFNQLQGVANGTGPNPAQAMLNQATGANTANQAALMAGQRGAGQNVGLIARQAAQQGAANQQNAAGQSATMQAQQSLGALNQLGGIAGQQVGQQQNALSGLNQNSLQQQANLLGLQSNINSANAGLAGQTMARQGDLLGGVGNAIGSILAEGGQVRKPMAEGGGAYAPINTQDPAYQQLLALGQPQQSVSPVQAAAPAPTAPAAPQVPQAAAKPQASTQGPASKFLQHINSGGDSSKQQSSMFQTGNAIGNALIGGAKALFGNKAQAPSQPDASETQLQNQLLQNNAYTGQQQQAPAANDMQSGGNMAAKGGKVPALVSPGEVRIKAEDVPKVAAGKKSPMDGEKIPGKPKVGGAENSYANDTVPKTLNEGDIILPRSVTQAKHPHWEAHKFVSAIMAKNKGKLK